LKGLPLRIMAKKRIVISERDNIATLFQGDQAIEFIIHRGDILLGDICLATVENILPSIDAAFVHMGGGKMGFLHSSDVQGKGDLKLRLKPKQRILVQVMKEPTGHKGPRVTTQVSLPGRFLVMMPEAKGISISRKIEQQSERSRLKSIVSLIKPPGMGVIIRTEANGVSNQDIQEDFEVLLERWQNIVAIAEASNPPALLYRDQDLLYRVIREMVTEDVQELIVDTPFGYQRAQQLLQQWNLDKHLKVTQHTGNQSILVTYGVDREIKQALQTKVPMPSGGYLYVQQTEALTVVDVNSGKLTSLQTQAETIRITNLEAIKEIARQLRLRNIGGMIIVDFIDMESRADQLMILEAFENELATDKAKPQIGQLSDLGLVEMTRHRQGQSLHEIFTHTCSSCNGTAHVLDEFLWASPALDPERATATERPNLRNRLPNRPHPRFQQNQQQQQQGGNNNEGGGFGNQQQAPVTPSQSSKPTALIQRSGRPGHANNPVAPVSPGASRILSRSGQEVQKSIVKELTGKQLFEKLLGPKPGSFALKSGEVFPVPETRPAESRGGDRDRRGGGNNGVNGETGQPLEDVLRALIPIHLPFATVAKFGMRPAHVNNLLSRLNPKAQDIHTLVEILLSQSDSPLSMTDDGDDDDLSMDGDDGPQEPVNVPPPRSNPEGHYRQGGRGHFNRQQQGAASPSTSQPSATSPTYPPEGVFEPLVASVVTPPAETALKPEGVVNRRQHREVSPSVEAALIDTGLDAEDALVPGSQGDEPITGLLDPEGDLEVLASQPLLKRRRGRPPKKKSASASVTIDVTLVNGDPEDSAS
jgi:Rne/Rng family ribonuclease